MKASQEPARVLPFIERKVELRQEQPFPLPLLFGKGLMLSMRKSQGALPVAYRDGLPRISVERKGMVVDAARVSAYRAVCGYPAEVEALPATYPETLFLEPMGMLVTSEAFPLSPMGLIHIGQRIEVHQPITPGENMDLRCALREMRETARGLEIDIEMEVFVADTMRWEGIAYFLSRAKGVGSGGGRKGAQSGPSLPEVEAWRVPENMGRRYARVSGDWNPHHLWPVTARLLGYKRPIAHGMWTMARALGGLESRDDSFHPVQIETWFKRPIFMPGTAKLHASEDGAAFEVWDAEGKALHATGRTWR